LHTRRAASLAHQLSCMEFFSWGRFVVLSCISICPAFLVMYRTIAATEVLIVSQPHARDISIVRMLFSQLQCRRVAPYSEAHWSQSVMPLCLASDRLTSASAVPCRDLPKTPTVVLTRRQRTYAMLVCLVTCNWRG
jgi:hypothetical protein